MRKLEYFQSKRPWFTTEEKWEKKVGVEECKKVPAWYKVRDSFDREHEFCRWERDLEETLGCKRARGRQIGERIFKENPILRNSFWEKKLAFYVAESVLCTEIGYILWEM